MSLANMRTRVSRLLDHQVTQYRDVPTPDAQGGQATVRTLLGVLPGRRRQPVVAVEADLAQQDVSNVMDVIYFAPDADVRRNDELHLGNDVFDVHATYQPSGSIYLRADCRSRQR